VIGIWGMATKGLGADRSRAIPDRPLPRHQREQAGAFVPLAGHMITSPDALLDRAFDRAPLLDVMNENYRDEIERTCQELGVEPTLASLGEI
jgi:hypothetical protein